MIKSPLREAESLFSELSGAVNWNAVDVTETDDAFQISMDLPGYEEDDIEIRITDHTLHIDAERETETEEDEDFIRRERRHHSVSRTIQLTDAIDKDETEATYQNGVLTVTVPKESEAETEAHTVPVN